MYSENEKEIDESIKFAYLKTHKTNYFLCFEKNKSIYSLDLFKDLDWNVKHYKLMHK